MSINVIGLFNELKNEWAEFQKHINKINDIVSKIVGDEKKQDTTIHTIANKQVSDIPRWKYILNIFIRIGGKAKFNEIMKELEKEGVEITKNEQLKTRSVITHLMQKKLLGRDDNEGYYFVIKNP